LQLLRGAHLLLLKAKNIPTGCRLALVNNDLTKALVFEPDRKTTSESEGGTMASNPKAPAPAVDPQIHVTEIALENTLLLDAVQKGKARFVSDCASYIQSCMKPATDIFISGQEMVASIVVLPLIFEGQAFGGFYVTLEVICCAHIFMRPEWNWVSQCVRKLNQLVLHYYLISRAFSLTAEHLKLPEHQGPVDGLRQ
jgi:hypothetical protein